MTNELRTNDEPQRILLEASERIKACYPDGAKIVAKIGDERITGKVFYNEIGEFVIVSGAEIIPFSPAAHPHRVLP